MKMNYCLVVTALSVLAAPALPAATVNFSGETWTVKTSQGRVGPGPNYFSDSKQNVWVDSQGRLHLAITTRKGKWYCAEVISQHSRGYGTYKFHLDTPVDSLDPKVVLGLFTWNDAAAYNHREIDIEFSRWGAANNLNAQYVIQPYDTAGNIFRWNEPGGRIQTVHSFTWTSAGITFQSIDRATGLVLQSWSYDGPDNPVPGGENARMNLWLFQGAAPSNRQGVEIIVNKFEFVPGP